MSNLLKNNIFVQKSKEKFNPDILEKKNNLEKDRNNNIFRENKYIYNSITNNTPDVIKNIKDLELKKDLPINNMKNILEEKNKERLEQELKQNELNRNNNKKIIFDDLISNNESCLHNNLKNEQNDFIKSTDTTKKYNNIVNNLKNLGII
jgi:hypothetical protein